MERVMQKMLWMVSPTLIFGEAWAVQQQQGRRSHGLWWILGRLCQSRLWWLSTEKIQLTVSILVILPPAIVQVVTSFKQLLWWWNSLLFDCLSAPLLKDIDIRVGDTFDGSTYDKSSFNLGAHVEGALGPSEIRTIQFEKAVTGRYVAISLDFVIGMTICELQVYTWVSVSFRKIEYDPLYGQSV